MIYLMPLLLVSQTGDGGLTETSTAPLERHVIVVGYNAAERADRRNLRFADDDAARMFEMVAPASRSAHLLTVFDETSERLFPELVPIARTPTRAALERALGEVRIAVEASRSRGARPELVFFYAGHGDVDDGMGFVTLARDRWSRKDLEQSLLRGIDYEIAHVIIDACKSYFMVSGRGPGGEREPASTYAGPAPHPGVGLILSTTSDAESHEFAELQAGIFAHEVRSALLGGADLDQSGSVDYSELGAFVATANEAIPIPRYRPEVFVRPPPGRTEAALPSPLASRRLRLAAPLAGRIRVRDPRGLIHADIHKAPGQVVSLALLRLGRHEVEWAGRRFDIEGDEAQVIELTESSLSSGRPAAEARGLEHDAFAHLFARPLSLDVVRGFRLARRSPGLALVDPPAPDRTRQDWGLGVSVGGSVSLIAGAVMAAVAADVSASAGEADRSQASRSRQLDQADAWTAASVSALSAGTAALVTGALLLFLD